MKAAINKETMTIVDILPDNADSSNKFILNNGYILAELEAVLLEDGTFRELTEEEKAPIALKEANEMFGAEIAKLKAGVPEDEVLTWTEQKQEARAWQLDNSVETPCIDGILSKRSRYNKAELVTKILEKAKIYSKLTGELIGTRQEIEDNQ